MAERTVRRIRARHDRPFAVTCSFNWPHDPNVIPSPYYDLFDPAKIELPANWRSTEPRFAKELSAQMVGDRELRLREFLRIYYGSVRMIDDQVGKVLDALDASGHAGNTVVVFTSDHGDYAGGHGMAWKSTSAFYDEVARVPLLVSWPGQFRPGTTEAECGLVDLAPTILDVTGHSSRTPMAGTSLLPVLRGGSSSRRSHGYRFCERVAGNAARSRDAARTAPGAFMVRGQGWKYARYRDGGEYLYNLQRDPGETRNLAGERSAQAQQQELRSQAKRWLRETGYAGPGVG